MIFQTFYVIAILSCSGLPDDLYMVNSQDPKEVAELYGRMMERPDFLLDERNPDSKEKFTLRPCKFRDIRFEEEKTKDEPIEFRYTRE